KKGEERFKAKEIATYSRRNREQRGGELAGRGGGDGDAEFLEFGAGEAMFVAAGEAFDDFAEFADAAVLLAELEEGHAFAETRGAELETLGIVGEDFVVGGDGVNILLLLVKDFAEVELSVRGEIGFGVVLEVVLKFGAGEIVFAAGDVAEAVGVKRVGGRRASGNAAGTGTSRISGGLCCTGCAGRGSGSGEARSRSRRGATGDLGIETLHGVLEVNELLVELAEAGLNFFEVVRKTLDLRGHRVQTCAGIGLNVLDGLLERAHGGAELANSVIGLADERLHDSVVLSDLRGEILLALEKGSDVALKLDEFAGDGFRRAWADQASGESAGQNGGAKNSNVTNTHEHPPKGY